MRELSAKSSIVEMYFDTNSCCFVFLVQKVGVQLVQKAADASVIMKRHRGPNIDTSTRSPFLRISNMKKDKRGSINNEHGPSLMY